jgi:hypothetical protein
LTQEADMVPSRLKFLFVIACALAAHDLVAATCRVAPAGAGNGSSWSSPMSLQDALGNAACAEIWVRAGVYKPVQPANPDNPTAAERRTSFEIRPGKRVYGGFAGHETRRDDRDPAQHRTVLSGDIDNDDTVDEHGIVTDPAGNRFSNSHHVVLINGGTGAGPVTAATVLDGVTITSGRANGATSDRLHMGGGLLCLASNTGQECSPTLRDVVFSGNVANVGGALYLLAITGGRSQPLLHRVHFSANLANSLGGAVYVDGANAGDARPLFREVRFTGNRANSYGGAVLNDGSEGGNSHPAFEQVQFSGNNGSYGGAIYNDAHSGGRAMPAMANVTFHGNTASRDGGAIYNHASGNGDGRIRIDHATFSANTAANGGAIYNLGSAATPQNAGPVVRNSIFWGNQAGQGAAEIENDAARPDIAASIVSGGCPEHAQCAGLVAGNPLLGPLADNGGSTLTLKPNNGSPAINAADDGHCAVIDQRGVPRAQGLRCDIGAVEVEAPACHVKADATGSNNGASWANAYTDLQSALADAGCGEIRVARGVYTPATGGNVSASFAIRPGQRVYGGFAGAETQLEQRDPAANPTVLSADIDGDDVTDADGIVVHGSDRRGSNARRVVNMDGTTAAGPILATTVLDGFAITGAAGWELDGGGLRCHGAGAGNECSPTLANLLFSANLADQGGGLFNGGGNGGRANPTLVNVTFRNNTASYGGGGMYNQGWQGGESSPTLVNVTFAGNLFTAMVNDGNLGGRSSPSLNHVTFSGNVGRTGAASVSNSGVDGSSEPVFTNVIAWGGSMSIPDEPECELEICNTSAIPVFTGSIVAGGCPGGSLCGPDVIDADPMLGPLAHNGGSTPTMLPDPEGAAVDAGDDAGCAAFDQRGFERPQGDGCDIGAVEWMPGGEDRIFADDFEP